MNEWERGNDRQFVPGHVHGYPPGYSPEAQMNLPKKRKWLAGLLAFFIPGTGHLYLGQMAKGISIMFLTSLNISAIVFAGMSFDEPLIIVLLALLLPIIYFYNLFDAIQSADVVNQRLRYPVWQPPAFAPQQHYPVPHPPAASAVHPGYEAPSGQPDSSVANASAQAGSGVGEQGTAGPDPSAFDRMPPPAQGPAGMPRQLNATGVMVLAAIVIVLVLVTGMGWSGWVFRSSGSMAGAVLLIGAGIGLWLWEMRGDRDRKR